MSDVGHNNPPSSIEFAAETTADLGRWLENHPVIQSEDDARAGKLLVDRAKGTLADLDDERRKKVDPLNEQVKEINNTFKPPRETLNKVLGHLTDRLTAYLKAEKAKREQEAEDRRLALEAAEKRAREAEEREQEAIEDAAGGVVSSGVADAISTADAAFAQYQTAAREAARAEKETDVKLPRGLTRRMGLRIKKGEALVNWNAAISEMGLSEDLIEAILKDARAYRKSTNRLPEGVIATYEESL